MNQFIRRQRQEPLINLKKELGINQPKAPKAKVAVEKAKNDIAQAVSAQSDFAKAIAEHIAAQKAKAASS